MHGAKGCDAGRRGVLELVLIEGLGGILLDAGEMLRGELADEVVKVIAMKGGIPGTAEGSVVGTVDGVVTDASCLGKV